MLRPEIKLPRQVRIVLIVLAVILGTIVLVKALSQEDCWIKGSEGRWIKHGNPSAPKPSEVKKRE